MQVQVHHAGPVLLDPWCVVGICWCTQCVGGVCFLWCVEFVYDRTGIFQVDLGLDVRLLVCLCLLRGWLHIFGCNVVLWYVILLCSLAGFLCSLYQGSSYYDHRFCQGIVHASLLLICVLGLF